LSFEWEFVDLWGFVQFEEISGAAELRADYDRLNEEAKDRETDYLRAFDRKKNLAKERKQIREQKEEAEKFQTLVDKKNKLVQQFFLWQLYQAHLRIRHSRSSLRKNKIVRLCCC
jgi:structural maintenance of chromosome 1